MNNFHKLKIELFCFGLICLTCLCLSCAKTDDAESKRPLQVAFQNRIGSAIPIVAVEKGYFQKEGIDVRVLRFNSGPACAEALYSGSADVGAMGDSTAIMALVRHGKLKLIASHGSGEHRHRLIVRQDGSISSLKDLMGKRVAIKKGTSTHGGFLALMSAKGIPPKAVTVVDLNPGTMPEALMAGSVDAVAASEPTPSLVEARGGRELITFGGLGNSYPILMLTNASVIEERKEDLVRFFRALRHAEDFVNTHPNETAKILSRVTGLSLPLTQKAMKRHEYRLRLDEATLSSLQSTAKFLMKHYELPTMPDLAESLETRFLRDSRINPIRQNSGTTEPVNKGGKTIALAG